MKFSNHFQTKIGMVEPTMALFKRLKMVGHPVKNLRMDNAGENLKLLELCQQPDSGLSIEFELTT